MGEGLVLDYSDAGDLGAFGRGCVERIVGVTTVNEDIKVYTFKRTYPLMLNEIEEK